MYKLTKSNSIIRLADNATIPLPANESEGWKYEAWLAEGNTPFPVDPPTIDELNAPIFEEIAKEESKQSRAIREHILGDTTAITRLRAIDDAIKAARLKLKK